MDILNLKVRILFKILQLKENTKCYVKFIIVDINYLNLRKKQFSPSKIPIILKEKKEVLYNRKKESNKYPFVCNLEIKTNGFK